MKNDKKIEDLLSESTGFEEKMLDKINESCNVFSDDQKKRVLDIIERKLSEEKHDKGENAAGSEEKKVRIIEHKRNLSRFLVPMAACLGLAAGLMFLKGNSVKEDLTPLDKPQITEEKGTVTSPVQTIITEKAVILPVTDVTENVQETVVTKIVTVLTEGISEKMPETESSVPETVKETEPFNTEATEITKITSALPEVTEGPEYYEYQVVYKEFLDKLRYETNGISTIEYMIYDMNDDDVPELITITGKSEEDETVTFYTIKDHLTVAVGEGAPGVKNTFYIDERTDRPVIRNAYGGKRSVICYIFDGNTVKESLALKDYDYESDPEGFNQAVSEMFDLRFKGSGLVYSGPDGSSNLIAIDGAVIKLNNDSYTFTD